MAWQGLGNTYTVATTIKQIRFFLWWDRPNTFHKGHILLLFMRRCSGGSMHDIMQQMMIWELFGSILADLFLHYELDLLFLKTHTNTHVLKKCKVQLFPWLLTSLIKLQIVIIILINLILVSLQKTILQSNKLISLLVQSESGALLALVLGVVCACFLVGSTIRVLIWWQSSW